MVIRFQVCIEGRVNWICIWIGFQELKEISWEVYYYYCFKLQKNGFVLIKLERNVRGKGLREYIVVYFWIY